MAKPKPLVQVATLCESVLTEADRVASVIRVIDTLYLTPIEDAPKDVVGQVLLTLYVSLKSGDVKGEYDVELILRAPSGKKAVMPKKWHIAFLGQESGATLTMRAALPVREFGLYWYDVVWEGEVLTSIPIKLVEGPKPAQSDAERQTSAMD
jgi:hypothetical protein